MTDIEIASKNWSLKVNLVGGRILELKKRDTKILGTFERIDGKLGNTHLCVPNFANEGVGEYGLPFHGPSRNGEWVVKEQTENSLAIYFEIKDVGTYPGFIGIGEKFEINDEEFKQTIAIKNLGQVASPLNLGIHNYFESEMGWRGIKINGVDVSRIVEISDYIELKSINEIQIPGKESIIWKTDGFKFAKLWTGFKESEGQKVFDEKYVCIEPVLNKEGFVETQESNILGGDVLVLEQSF